MLGGLALKRRWQQRRAAEGKPTDRPNLVMGINVQVCWEKFANYWDVEMRLVPMEGDRFHLSAEEAVEALRREHDRRRRDPRLDVRRLVRARRGDLRRRSTTSSRRRGLDVPVHVDGASGAFDRPVPRPGPAVGLPAAPGRLDQHVRAQVRPRLPGRRLDRLARRRRAAGGPDLLGQLPGRQHADVRAQLLAARRAGGRAVLQLPPARLRGVPQGAGLRAGRGHAALGARSRSSGRSSS